LWSTDELDSTNIEDIIKLAFDIDAKAQVIVGIGGGKVIDVAKYAAYLRKLPFISIPTSASFGWFLKRQRITYGKWTAYIGAGKNGIWNHS